MVTLQDTKCVMDNCRNICPWDSYSTVCEACWDKYVDLRYCLKCKKICDVRDATGISMKYQHMPDWRCTGCGSKPVDYLDTVKGFTVKYRINRMW